MSTEFRTIALGAAAFAVSLAALAQTAPATAAQPTPGAYNSAFDDYRPFSTEESGDWRKANETVREVGGWRAYAREIQGGTQNPAQPGGATAPAPPAASAPSAAPTGPAAPAPSAHPHQGHQQ